jgi:hypothetical protein
MKHMWFCTATNITVRLFSDVKSLLSSPAIDSTTKYSYVHIIIISLLCFQGLKGHKGDRGIMVRFSFKFVMSSVLR